MTHSTEFMDTWRAGDPIDADLLDALLRYCEEGLASGNMAIELRRFGPINGALLQAMAIELKQTLNERRDEPRHPHAHR
jgi:hypothetical protein